MDRGARQAGGGTDEVAQLMSRRSRPGELEMRAALGAVEQGLFGRPQRPIRLQRFTLLSRVGSGGLGVVYAAYDPQLDRKVAIKLLREGEGDSGSGSGSIAARGLVAEAQAIARLTHPNVVAVHDVGTYAPGELDSEEHATKGGVFIVMEYVEGEDLEHFSRERERPLGDIVDRFVEAGRGLEAAHAAGIVHRDFKPQNAIVGRDGRVRVLDFGLASSRVNGRLGAPSPNPSEVETIDGAIAGTPRFMSPEQHRGDRVDARSDQFSFCVSLFSCLTGKAPFAGRSLSQLADAKTRGPDEALRASDLPPWMTRILRRGMAFDPTARFETMGELLRALTRGRQTRKRRAMGLVGVALVLVSASAVWVGSQREDLCLEHAQRLVGVWDEPRREKLRVSLLGTERPYADAAARSVIERLDGYARAWLSGREATCRESLTTHDGVSAPRLEREALCLDRRLAAADELAGLVIEHPEEVVEHAVDAAAALPSIEDCLRVPNIDRPAALETAADRERLAALRQRLARAQANFDAANYDAGVQLAASLVDAADAFGDVEVRARARLVLGRYETQLARGRAADETLFAAHELAERIGDDELVAELLVARAQLERRLLGRYGEADRLLRLARVRVQELGLGDDVRGQLEHETVLLRRKQGRYAQARLAGERLLAIRTRRADGQPSKVGDAHMALAEVHYKTRDFEAAAREIRQAQDAWSRSQGAAHPATSAGEQRLGDMAWRTGRYADALAHHERAYRIELQARGPDHPRTWVRAIGLANVQAALGQHHEAYPTLVAGLTQLQVALGPDHPTSVATQLNLGSVLVEGGYPHAAEPHLLEALDRLEQDYSEQNPSLPYALLELGRARAQAERPGEALLYFEDALDTWRGALGESHPKLAWVWREMGETHLALGARPAAARAFRSAIAVHDESTNDPLHLGDLYFGLARSESVESPEASVRLTRRALELYGESPYRRSEIVEARAWVQGLD